MDYEEYEAFGKESDKIAHFMEKVGLEYIEQYPSRTSFKFLTKDNSISKPFNVMALDLKEAMIGAAEDSFSYKKVEDNFNKALLLLLGSALLNDHTVNHTQNVLEVITKPKDMTL